MTTFHKHFPVLFMGLLETVGAVGPESSLWGLVPTFPGTRWLPHVSQAVFLPGLIEDIGEI